jgi:hypothetical protein
MQKSRCTRHGDFGTEEIFSFGSVIGNRHMGAGAIGISLWHHDGRMNNFQITNSVRVGLGNLYDE